MTGPPLLEGRLVVAVCRETGAIGYNGGMPWPHLRADMKHFNALTRNHAVLMGPATYSSLPPASRPLPHRLNVVLSSRSRQQLDLPPDVLLAGSWDAAAELLLPRGVRVVYVIGGAAVYKGALDRPQWSTRVHLTEVSGMFDGDTFLSTDMLSQPDFELISISQQHTSSAVSYRMLEYVRKTAVPPPSHPAPYLQAGSAHAEYQYLDLVRRILHTGTLRGDRTGTGTLSLFGESMRFNLRDSFPLLTTKRVFWRGVAEELLWFIRGGTDSTELSQKGIHIWEGNGSRQFLDSRGLTDREVGDLGPVYGFQWRHFGADYSNMHADYSGKGVDQLANVIETLKKDPTDRRMLISAWNPAATHLMALPPCHLLTQFYVADGELSCQMYQRSCDMGLGVPFNIASYSLLTVLIAEVTGLKAGDFVHVMGDAHVYCNHVDALQEQLLRVPKAFPTLRVRHRDTIDEFCFDDLILQGYEPHKNIAMKMAV